MQGESDAQSDQFRDNYAANLRNLIVSVRRDFNSPTLPFVFGQIIDFDHPISTPVRDQQQAVTDDATVTNTAFVLTDDLCHQDFIHFNGRAIYALGVRFAAAYLSMVDAPPTVYISPTATFGCNSIIGNGTVINSGVSIGKDAEIGASVTLNKLVRAGDNLRIGDRAKIDQGTTLGENVTIGSNVTIGKTAVIGSGVVIGDNTIIGTDVRIGAGAQIGIDVKVGTSATVAANAIVPPGTSIGSKKSFP